MMAAGTLEEFLIEQLLSEDSFSWEEPQLATGYPHHYDFELALLHNSEDGSKPEHTWFCPTNPYDAFIEN
jgi:hypothetical protein